MTASIGSTASTGSISEPLPHVLEGDAGVNVQDFLARHRDELRERLTRHGAVLLRGFDIGGVDGFDGVVRTVSGTPPLTYAERSSPRSTIKGQVYTSTDYPPNEEIFLHNENSYQASWPLTLYFYCLQPPLTQGATPLADIRAVYQALDPDVRDEFALRGWQVVRNFHGDFGVSWQQAFNTEDRDAVAGYCAERGIKAEWRDQNWLRTTALRAAIHLHPVTGRPVWFNHATFFNVRTLDPEIRQGLLEIFEPQDLPTNTFYGDGGTIPDDVLDHLQACYRAASVRFDWQQDDVLVVDNMSAAHGREPYTGPRKIAVAMAEPSHQSVTT